ncbi:hypothetical protein [Labrenzia sp. PHM005]|uniref:hypothetical protein n=1 Tax=Labrenzia sp. PHM005 TaxID=2590016 RepID=UPI001140627E|nr:hypothetical protein [Labrenzia sp. PHM005]QDG75760.1 hypothetical protein FJ695_07760 [Labrenzia sp. PHM005]
MSQPDYRDEGPEEAPLDPATQRVQAKLKRLLLGSSLIMFAGFIAVFAAILYKINSYEADPYGIAFTESVNVGPDAEVLQVTLADGMMLVLVREGTTTALLRFDPANGKLLGRTAFIGR